MKRRTFFRSAGLGSVVALLGFPVLKAQAGLKKLGKLFDISMQIYIDEADYPFNGGIGNFQTHVEDYNQSPTRIYDKYGNTTSMQTINNIVDDSGDIYVVCCNHDSTNEYWVTVEQYPNYYDRAHLGPESGDVSFGPIAKVDSGIIGVIVYDHQPW